MGPPSYFEIKGHIRILKKNEIILSYFRTCYNLNFIFDNFLRGSIRNFDHVSLFFCDFHFNVLIFFTLQSGVSSRQAHDRLAFSGGPGWHM